MEQWRAVVGYEGLYEVSNMGQVRSLARRTSNSRNRIAARILMPSLNRGYPNVHLSKHAAARMEQIHRLVATAFIGPPTLPHVNHLNGDKTDNRVENLEYTTAKGNVQHACAFGLRDHRGERNHKAVLRPTDVQCIKQRLRAGEKAPRIARDYGVQSACIYKIRDGRTWKHLAA